MRVLVVTNPRATMTTARQRDVLVGALASIGTVTLAETANRGHAAALACRAMRDGTDVVVALGGDGTINEVVNGLLTDGVHDRIPALGVVPAGSTNVFARALGLPNDPVDATALLLEGLRNHSRRMVSLGTLDDRWFTFAAGIGFDAAIVERVERARRRGKKSTHVLYARLGVREFLTSNRRKAKLHIDLSDGTRLDGVHMAVVANADPFTFVGNRPLRPTPGVTFDDDLALYARKRMGTAGMLFSMGRMLINPPRVGKRGAHLLHGLEGLVITADEPMPAQVDGDFLGLREKVIIRSVKDALPVVI